MHHLSSSPDGHKAAHSQGIAAQTSTAYATSLPTATASSQSSSSSSSQSTRQYTHGVNSKLHYILNKDSQQSLKQQQTPMSTHDRTSSFGSIRQTATTRPPPGRSLSTSHQKVNTSSASSRPASPVIQSPLSALPTPRGSPSAPPSPIHNLQGPGSTSSVSVKETHHINIDYDPVSGRKMLNKYEVIKEIGRGQHGKVKLGRNMDNGDYVAIKIVDRTSRPRLGKTASSSSQEEKIKREIAILKKCDHPNIVRLIEVLDDLTSKKIYLVLEYLEKGEVSWQTESGNAAMSRKQAKSTCRDVLLGLEYLHYQGIVHRDIKPANLLLSRDGKVKISDFGVSYVSSGEDVDEYELAKTAGTPAFFAPELCMTTSREKRPAITKKIDIWAFGVTLFCLIYGRVPFIAESEFELFSVIANQPLVFPDEEDGKEISSSSAPRMSMFYGGSVSSDNGMEKEAKRQTVHESPLQPRELDADLELAKDLMRKLMEKDTEKRVGIEEIKRHPWICDGMNNSEQTVFLQVPVDDRIEVSGYEVRHAVQGITGKIKRGLSKFGSTALQFAGLRRRKSSTSSNASSRVLSQAPSTSTSRSSSRERGASTIRSNRQSPVGSLARRPSVQASIDRQTMPPPPPSRSRSKMSSSTKDLNLNALLEGNESTSPATSTTALGHFYDDEFNDDNDDDEEFENMEPFATPFNIDDFDDFTKFDPNTTSMGNNNNNNNNNPMGTTGSSSAATARRKPRQMSTTSSRSGSGSDSDDNGELTLVLGPPRAMSQSPHARLSRASQQLKSPEAEYEHEEDCQQEDKDEGLSRHRSHSVTVGVLQRGNSYQQEGR